MSVPSRRHLLFTLGMLAVIFLAVEAGLRGIVAIRMGPRALAYGFVADRQYETSDLNLHDDEHAGYSKYFAGQRLRDHNPDTGTSFVTVMNGDGFRGRNFEPKPPGAVRIVTLGASSTFGYHSQDHETYPAQLEERLGSRCPERTVQVFNLGIPHLMSDEIATLLEREGLPLEPDVVTFYEGINDATARRTRHQLRRNLRRFDVLRSPYRALRDRLLTVRFADEVLRPRVTPYDRDAVEAHLSGRGDTFFASLDRMRLLCEERGVLFVVVRQQAKSFNVPRDQIRGVTYTDERDRVERKLEREGRLEPPEAWFLAHAGMMGRLPGWAMENGVPFVDGAAATDARRDVLLSWVHLTPEGNGLLADALAEVLVDLVCPR